MSDKTMKDIQAEVDRYIGQFKEGYFSPLAMMARLTYGFILSDHGLVHRGRTGVIRICHVAFRSEGQRKNVRHPENLVFAVCSRRYGILDI